MERPHGDAGPHRIHHHKAMGDNVMSYAGWYKAKIWLLPSLDSGLPKVPHLFKIGRPNTGENWAEKAACEIARALELPCATYNFAFRGEDKGVISERFIPVGANVAFGNLILSQMIPQYDRMLRFKQDKYQL